MPSIVVIGAHGLVGKELQHVLTKRAFPCEDLRLFHSSDLPDFSGVDLAFFCTSADVSKTLIPKALQCGVSCIDSSSAYRMDPSVPLVIPEINKEALDAHKGIIASPNCTTTLMLMAVAPLCRTWKVTRAICSSYQAVSGAGWRALETLEMAPTFDAFLHESAQNAAGYNEEEEKMHLETQKILQERAFPVSATCVRVPVRRAHSLSVNITFETEITLEEAKQALQNASGIEYADPPPSANEASNKEPIFCSRLRRDRTNPKSLELWIVGDQLLKGAALNSVQIAEEIITRSLLIGCSKESSVAKS